MNSVPSEANLILASASASRMTLMKRLAIPFSCVPTHIDEAARKNESPRDLVERLSRQKAHKVAEDYPQAIVIGSDQLATHRGRISGKPGSAEIAEQTLARFSGDRVTFLTGVCVHHQAGGFCEYMVDETTVVFRRLGRGEIARYVQSDLPMACAGSFRVESLGPALFEEVRTLDPTALMGLPLIGTARLLREAGYAIP